MTQMLGAPVPDTGAVKRLVARYTATNSAQAHDLAHALRDESAKSLTVALARTARSRNVVRATPAQLDLLRTGDMRLAILVRKAGTLAGRSANDRFAGARLAARDLIIDWFRAVGGQADDYLSKFEDPVLAFIALHQEHLSDGAAETEKAWRRANPEQVTALLELPSQVRQEEKREDTPAPVDAEPKTALQAKLEQAGREKKAENAPTRSDSGAKVESQALPVVDLTKFKQTLSPLVRARSRDIRVAVLNLVERYDLYINSGGVPSRLVLDAHKNVEDVIYKAYLRVFQRVLRRRADLGLSDVQLVASAFAGHRHPLEAFVNLHETVLTASPEWCTPELTRQYNDILENIGDLPGVKARIHSEARAVLKSEIERARKPAAKPVAADEQEPAFARIRHADMSIANHVRRLASAYRRCQTGSVAKEEVITLEDRLLGRIRQAFSEYVEASTPGCRKADMEQRVGELMARESSPLTSYVSFYRNGAGRDSMTSEVAHWYLEIENELIQLRL